MKGEKRRKRKVWALWAKTTEEQIVEFYDPPLPIIGRPPAAAEQSADGNWATVYADGTPVVTFVKLGV